MRTVRLVFVALMVGSISLPALAASDEPWEFEGGGWGHGVGLSQFGALGMAEDNKTATQILTFYYKDTKLGTMPQDHWTTEDDGLLVGLVSKATKVTLGVVGDGDVVICQPSDCSDPDRELTLTTEDDWFFEIKQNDGSVLKPLECRIRRGHSSTGGENWDWGPCDARVTQPAATDTRIKVDGQEYAHGVLHLSEWTDGFHAVLGLTMQKYLYGLAEVPSSWPSEALKVQAIIGRSYALATAEERKSSTFWATECGCHIRDTSSDQVYVGWSKEDPNTGGAAWQEAVNATDLSILTHDESQHPFKVAKAFYSSSNGGWSENNDDVWPGGPIPWLRSVEDKWSSDPDVNPLASWTVSVTDEDMAAFFGWDRALDAFILEGPPGVLVKFTGIDDGESVSKTLDGSQVASLLKTHGFDYSAPGSPNSDPNRPRVSPYISAVFDPPGFDDIVGHLFEADIDWAAEVGITKGCNPPDNTLFCPDDEVSREVMAAFLNRYLELPPASKDYFTDDDGSIFEDDINRLAEAGITKGCGGTNFCPGDLVDRGQMAAFLVRAFGLTDDGGGDLFTDDDDSIFEGDIDRLGTAGITRGCNPPTNDQYCPTLAVDRGAMTAFLHRASSP